MLDIEFTTKSKRERDKENYMLKLKQKRRKKKEAKRHKHNKNIKSKNKYKDSNNYIGNINLNEYQIEYVDQMPDKALVEAMHMQSVFDHFKYIKAEPKLKVDLIQDEEGFEEESKQNDNKPLSKKQQKQMSRIKLTELKEMTKFPEIVETWDTTAKDPKLLIFLKSLRNTVPVPRHWAQKRKYLQSQRGVLRNQFKLPDFIEATGIEKIRNIDAPETKILKLKMRQRMLPKLGRMEIDYQVLHDAFFKYQTKPVLSKLGDVYYENKEFETKMRGFQPGKISQKLRTALGISENGIPTFVANMQRYGPPPAYPNLKIPGVNVPLNDPTAEITPNLWGPQEAIKSKELVWDYQSQSGNHWGELKEEEEVEVEENDDYEDMEQDESEEKVNVEGIFDKDNEEVEDVKLLSEEPKEIQSQNINDINDKFYKELPLQEAEIKEGELMPIGFKYKIENNDMKEIVKEKTDNISISSDKYFEGEDSENSEEIGKKIF